MACGNETAVCGWGELFSGDLVGAAYTMYDAAFANWVVAILFIVYQFILYTKTKNLNLTWITGLFFLALYAASHYVKEASVQIMFLISVFELAGILYLLIFK